METSVSQIAHILSEMVRGLVVAEQECPPGTGAANTFESLDREIESLVQTRGHVKKLSELQQRKNQHLPVYRLPHDVYLHLFKLMYHANPIGGVGWKVSQVSRMWRVVTLSIPQLWSTIDKICPVFVEVCIARSGNVLLDITLDQRPYNSWFSPFVIYAQSRKARLCVASILPHAHRRRSLSLIRCDEKIFAPLLLVMVPQLERLRLEYFTAHLPRSGEAFLESLPLHSIAHWIQPNPLFGFLRCSPLLEELNLSNAVIPRPSTSIVVMPVLLPRLR
ncbi:hypothetical protein BOTBODRAFT_186771 [Botryobasidium botryosum FD-172 SS1]|uniref:F-box domain-containing protein n=1 Tax=Botryobasidium botryosum (strain FD-172 SS1) TaxID=930990 RepID=A0A067MMW7_BOTB1|nr:hypothetical protein BOTBODRAFT_186771 [Botryobasidium botryosum FD-172 SS1]